MTQSSNINYSINMCKRVLNYTKSLTKNKNLQVINDFYDIGKDEYGREFIIVIMIDPTEDQSDISALTAYLSIITLINGRLPPNPETWQSNLTSIGLSSAISIFNNLIHEIPLPEEQHDDDDDLIHANYDNNESDVEYDSDDDFVVNDMTPENRSPRQQSQTGAGKQQSVNKWIEHVKMEARKNNISYSQALRDPRTRQTYNK